MNIHIAALCLLAAPVAGVNMHFRDLIHSDRMLHDDDDYDYDYDDDSYYDDAFNRNLSPQCVETRNQLRSFDVQWDSDKITDDNDADYTLDKVAFDQYLTICKGLGGRPIVLDFAYNEACNYDPKKNTAYNIFNLPYCLGSMCDENDFVEYAINWEIVEANSLIRDGNDGCQVTTVHRQVGHKMSKWCKSQKGTSGIKSTKSPKTPKTPKNSKAPKASKANTLK